MSVEERLVRYAQSVAHRFTEVDQENLTTRLTDGVAAGGRGQELVERGGGTDDAASPPREVDEDGDPSNDSGSDSEYEHRLHQQARRHEQEGDADSARNIALLLEALGRVEEASMWWLRAAELGDADAVDYVKEYLEPSTVTTARQPANSEIRAVEPLGRGNSQAGRR